VRLLPPLIITEAEIDEAVGLLDRRLRGDRAAQGASERGERPAGERHERHAPRHFLDLTADFPRRATLRGILAARAMKASAQGRARRKPLAGKTLAMIFDKPSTRTRVSFDVGMRQLGGETIMLTGSEMQLGRGETIADTARVLSRYVDAIMIRTLDRALVRELAEHATVPVINGLTVSHPCQIMADVMTFEEHRGPIAGRRRLDRRRQQRARLLDARRRALRLQLRIATPPELARRRREDLLDWARAKGARSPLTAPTLRGGRGADCVVTDTWVSMGEKDARAPPQPARPTRSTPR
jgi:ornithine carbamoyltransferase